VVVDFTTKEKKQPEPASQNEKKQKKNTNSRPKGEEIELPSKLLSHLTKK
jgi:hypothetical protein